MGILTIDELLDDPGDQLPELLERSDGDSGAMRLLVCVIRPERLDAVKDTLSELGVIGGMTITDVRGFGRQRGSVEHYRGEPYTIKFLPKVRVEVGVRGDDVDAVMTAVRRVASSGQVGDGKIFVLDMRTAMRIRTGERGAGAL